jgi:hypothetical protein
MLYQLSYSRSETSGAPALGAARPKKGWEVVDLNHRRLTPAGLQPAPFGHSGNLPQTIKRALPGSRAGFGGGAPKELLAVGLEPATCSLQNYCSAS